MKRLSVILGIVLCAALASFYIYPIFSGLILLPLDLLVSNSGPWHMAGTILLKNPFMVDSVIQMFPWKHLTFTSLTSGIVPLWNPYQFMGVPFMAGMKSLVFYPANIFFVFGELASWNMLLWLQLFLSLWFTYLFVGSLGLEWEFSLLAGLAFAFNSLMVSVLEFGSEGQVLLWLPILLYFVKRYTDTKDTRYGAGLVFATASSIFADHLQYFSYLIMVVIAFALFYGKYTKKPLRSVYLAIGLGGVVAAVQLLPGIQMYRDSYRGIIGSYATFAGGLLHPYHFLRLLSPDWFGNPITLDLHSGYIEQSGYFGIIPLFFALYAAIYQRKNTYVRFFMFVALFALVFSMDGIAQVLYTLHVPVITSGYGSRIFSMFLFAGAVLSAFGFSAFMKEESDDRRRRALLYYLGLVATCFIAGVAVTSWNSAFGVHISNIKVQIAGIAVFMATAFSFIQYGKKFPLLKILLVACVLVLTYGDLFRLGYRFLTFSNRKFMYPEHAITKFIRSQVTSTLGREYGLSEPEIDTALGVDSTETYNPLFPVRTARLMQALENKTSTKLTNNKYYLTRNPTMKRVLDFLGVYFIVVPKGQNPAITLWNSSEFEKDITKVYEDDRTDVYQNLTAYPRFGLYYAVRDGVTDADALQMIQDQSVDFRKTLLMREKLSAPLAEGTGSADLVSSGLNTLEFRVQTTKPALFYLSDTYDVGWHVSVNDKETNILHANYNFRGVAVSEGMSVIKFWYLPRSFVVGGALSAIGIGLTVGFLWFSLYFDKRKSNERKKR